MDPLELWLWAGALHATRGDPAFAALLSVGHVQAAFGFHTSGGG